MTYIYYYISYAGISYACYFFLKSKEGVLKMAMIKKVYEVGNSVFGISVEFPVLPVKGCRDHNPGMIDIEKLWGTSPTWEDVVFALYHSEEGKESFGEQMEDAAKALYEAVKEGNSWRMDVSTGMSGRQDYLLRVYDPYRADPQVQQWGTAW